MPLVLVKQSPVTLPRVDESLAVLARALPSLSELERMAALHDADRLLDIRLALTRAPLEAGE